MNERSKYTSKNQVLNWNKLIAFVPSLDLVLVRQTGASGAWEYEEYIRRACDAALTK